MTHSLCHSPAPFFPPFLPPPPLLVTLLLLGGLEAFRKAQGGEGETFKGCTVYLFLNRVHRVVFSGKQVLVFAP